MNYLRKLFFLVLFLPLLHSCKNDLNVNAEWKDITVVYGLLNQNDSIHYVKITKAFLGEGDALSFAKIADSSNYPDKLDVKVEEWRFTSSSDSALMHTYVLDTVSIMNKDSGIFYYPTQLVYYFKTKLDTTRTYKLNIVNRQTGKVVYSSCKLIQRFTIKKPIQGSQANILPGKPIPTVNFMSAYYGRRYQLNIRMFYDEYHRSRGIDTIRNLSVDWIVFDNEVSPVLDGTNEFTINNFPGDGLYSTLAKKLKPVYTSDTSRHATYVDYIFTVASDDLNTYMDVTEPSNTIVQERPSFSNIVNGIGLFTSRYDNTRDNPRHLTLGQIMQDSLKAYSSRHNLGF
jgi:hypothetical protein